MAGRIALLQRANARAQGQEWVAAWKRAGPALELVHRQELRSLDVFAAIARLCGPADYTVAPRAPKPTSGLIEQQRLFRRARLDIALGGLPFEESVVARSTMFSFPPDAPLRTRSAEDLIVFKAFADRLKVQRWRLRPR